ncbi:MAG: CRTAC1 family protein [Deltaproteobacteria bacterium]
MGACAAPAPESTPSPVAPGEPEARIWTEPTDAVALQDKLRGTLPVVPSMGEPSPNRCAQASAPLAFDDVTVCAGVTGGRGYIHDYRTSGQAWADVDGDGDLDLYVTDSLGPNTLYANRGDGTFEVSEMNAMVADTPNASGGALFADYDNDGDQDLFVLSFGRNTLYRNDGGVAFVDITEEAGVGGVGMGQTGAFGDYDKDGFLDLYVTNWGCFLCAPEGEDWVTYGADLLYHNNGDGTFTDVSGLMTVHERTGAGYVASWFDYDNDLDLDLYVVNDKGYEGDPEPGSAINRNVLWENVGPGCAGWCFRERAIEAGADQRLEGMGLAIADYDDDDDLDLFFTNTGMPVLLENDGQGNFTDVTERAGVGFDHTSWGAVFFDYDNDGDQDLYYALGRTFGFDNPNRLFENLGDGTFADVSDVSGADGASYDIGVAAGDYDQDGAVDLVVGQFARGYRLLRNRTNEREGHGWISVRLEGGGPINRDGIGSRVFVETDDGRIQMQELKCGSSNGAGNDLALHFGLGDATTARVFVRWPDGLITSATGVASGTRLALAYPSN